MVNHFRTLMLNLPPSGSDDVRFSQYIPSDFLPVALDGVESAWRKAVFGENHPRERDELMATVLLRLVMDFEPTRELALQVDPRMSFDPRDPILGQFDGTSRPGLAYVPGNPLQARDDDVVNGTYERLADNMPAIPSLGQMWGLIGPLRGMRNLFVSQGDVLDTLEGLWALMETTRRDDHRVALTACAYCLRITERL